MGGADGLAALGEGESGGRVVGRTEIRRAKRTRIPRPFRFCRAQGRAAAGGTLGMSGGG
jgi:hypothetical protein